MITVAGCWMQVGWGRELGNGEMSVKLMGEVGKHFCPNFFQSFLETIDRRSCNNGSPELTPVFHIAHQNDRPSPSTVDRTMEYPVGVPS